MSRSPVVPVALVAALAAACQAPQPAAEEQPKRKSFAEANEWQPSAPSAAAGGARSSGTTTQQVDEQAHRVNEKWEQVRQTDDAAERQRLANEALRETRAMADQPSGQ
jgi:hypothetical protein